MNKQQKIIVSIVGITIVLLALLGITYAYYLTRIEGNTNTNSISITTADLKLVYSENSPEIITENNIMPGTTIGEKTFTVSNTGNSAVEDYKVVLEYAVIEGVVPSVFVRPEDFVITMTCVSKNIQTDEESGTCSGYTGTWNNESFEMTTNDIAENIKHEYRLTIFYANPDIDQSDDMGKNLNLKVQIYGANETSTITGTIDNVDETYAMKLNSNPKISTIKNVGTKENPKYQYKFIGVEHNSGDDSHTLTLVNKSNVEQSTGNITIKKGTNANISGSTITVKDNQSNIYLTTSKGESLTSTATFNPYSDNTNSLAYHIINNAVNSTNGTVLVDTPPSKIGQKSLDNWNLATEDNIYHDEEDKIKYYSANQITFQDCAYGNYDCDKVFEYNGCTDDVIGKYVTTELSNSPSDGSVPLVIGCNNNKAVLDTGKFEKVLSYENDDYGTSYYYRGNVKDNYVNFAGMCWRIVRIAGDGSIRLILEDKTNECDSESYSGDWSIGTGNYGYETIDGKDIINYLNPVTNKNKSMVKAFYDFQNNKLSSKLDKLKSGDWCIADRVYTRQSESPNNYIQLLEPDFSKDLFYDTYVRLAKNEFTLKCNGTKLKEFETVSGVSSKTPMYVGTLTADEVLYAGLGENVTPKYYYLRSKKNSYVTPWRLLSPGFTYSFYSDTLAYTIEEGLYEVNQVNLDSISLRPSINLASNINIDGGDGTQSNPYIIN